MIATRGIAKGEEVVNDYGPLSNSELLRAYGYVERNTSRESATALGSSVTVSRRSGGRAKVQSSSGSHPLSSTTAAGPLTARVGIEGETGPLISLRERLSSSGIPGNTNSHVQVGMQN